MNSPVLKGRGPLQTQATDGVDVSEEWLCSVGFGKQRRQKGIKIVCVDDLSGADQAGVGLGRRIDSPAGLINADWTAVAVRIAGECIAHRTGDAHLLAQRRLIAIGRCFRIMHWNAILLKLEEKRIGNTIPAPKKERQAKSQYDNQWLHKAKISIFSSDNQIILQWLMRQLAGYGCIRSRRLSRIWPT